MGRPAIAPRMWQPPPVPARARQRGGSRPWTLDEVVPVPGERAEDVAIGHDGTLFTGVEDGRVQRVDPAGHRVETVADTGGRPLGIEVLPDGRLVVCDAVRGLLRVDPATGTVDKLVGEVRGARMLFCNNAAVASDGTVYFSDSSRRFGIADWRAEILEHSCTGRLLRLAPDGSVDVLLDGMAFSNGVALAPDESYVAVAETSAYRVTRHWLTGESAGTSDVLVDNLPGFPDNMSTGGDGLLWIALASPRNALLDFVSPRNPLLRKGVWALPETVQERLEGRTTWVMAVDRDGAVVHDLQTSGAYPMVTGVRERDGTLYLGSLARGAIAVATVP
jgi:sugar lactone lactonase YvrE